MQAVTSKKITWVPKARWVIDGNIWTSSGVSTGESSDLLYPETPHDTPYSSQLFFHVRIRLEHGPRLYRAFGRCGNRSPDPWRDRDSRQWRLWRRSVRWVPRFGLKGTEVKCNLVDEATSMVILTLIASVNVIPITSQESTSRIDNLLILKCPIPNVDRSSTRELPCTPCKGIPRQGKIYLEPYIIKSSIIRNVLALERKCPDKTNDRGLHHTPVIQLLLNYTITVRMIWFIKI